MLDKQNCDRIIIDTIERTEEIIRWYQDNADWIDKIPFRAPIPAALVVLNEERIEFTYEPDGVGYRFHVWFWGIHFPIINFLYDPDAKAISDVNIAKIPDANRMRLAGLLLTLDNTASKEAIKFHSLMCFAAHYQNVIEVSEKRRNSLSKTKAKKLSRRSGREVSLYSTVYKLTDVAEKDRIESGASHVKRNYTKPTQEVSVRGYYRTTKTGKRVWVRPFTKYKGADKGSGTTYKVCMKNKWNEVSPTLWEINGNRGIVRIELRSDDRFHIILESAGKSVSRFGRSLGTNRYEVPVTCKTLTSAKRWVTRNVRYSDE